MVYKAIGLMSGSSLDGLDIAYVHFQETGGKWTYELLHTACYTYSNKWKERLKSSIHLSALDYQLLHCDYGYYLGQQVNQFIQENHLQHKVDLVASHGHTSFHLPSRKMSAQLGNGASIAAETALPVVSDLRAMDVAFGGQGAPIVPIGEKLLMSNYRYFLNLGGIANISMNLPEKYVAFDVCPANRVLNMLMNEQEKDYDDGGKTAASGQVNKHLLKELNELSYYQLPAPKSLANDFGINILYPLIKKHETNIANAACTMTEHIAIQIKNAIETNEPDRLLVTGGGANNHFLVGRIGHHLQALGIEVIVPDTLLVNYKEALVMAFIGTLRWREEYNVLSGISGATRSSINGAVWLGNEA
jgi:anhydro-N-acetylmuramic acid kinase